ncbi:3-dehydroquinate synthase [Tundrisphaera lichenicola]|uniref:3-dehydroquinate synthase n=1 Tax=Tundrisphaera lichenicola TaxID=2029860 RepID=UPI003EB7C8C5
MLTSVNVELGPRSYEVRIVSGAGAGDFGAFAREALGSRWAGRDCRSALLVTDENLEGMAGDYARALDGQGISTSTAVIPAGESSKSLDRASDLYDRLVAMRADRQTCVVGLGGGVVGDLAGFVAATYARGLPLLMIPTSLLAMVDSSVGGKVGVNHPGAKNIIGAFHQPTGVWIDTASLGTLPAREWRCGLAEVVKYGVILDAPFFDFLEEAAGAIAEGEPNATRRIIARSCELKAGVVGQDEREETGLRAVLNFGHTVGHSIEAVSGYGGAFQHGEAVAVGMVAESRLAEGLGWIGPEPTDRLTALLRRFGLPVEAPGLDADALIEAMGRDKKNQRGKIRFVLPRMIGRVELIDAQEGRIREAIAATIAPGGSGDA